jgi:hypothetical protein
VSVRGRAVIVIALLDEHLFEDALLWCPGFGHHHTRRDMPVLTQSVYRFAEEASLWRRENSLVRRIPACSTARRNNFSSKLISQNGS